MPAKAISSPRWTPTTKLIAGFTLVAIIAALLVRFSGLIGPLLFAFILTYLLHPLAKRFSEATQLSWQTSVNIVFLIFIFIVILLATLAGFAIVDQLGNLINVLQGYAASLPDVLQSLSTQSFQIGPFHLNFAELERMLVEEFGMDFTSIGQQLLSAVQPALGQAGTFLGALATSTLTTIGWAFFIFVITYFLLTDAGRAPDYFRNADLPGHDADIRRIGRELSRIWNTFLRGQLLLVSIIMLSSFTLMTILGVRNALGLALITGLAKFVPYIGSLFMYITTALVAFFQVGNYLGIEPATTYTLVVTLSAIVMDLTFDNAITPRFYGRALGVHPAAVLVTALILASLVGVLGLLLAAPALASLQLIATYIFRKMLDLDPWPNPEPKENKKKVPLARRLQLLWERIQQFIDNLINKGKKKK